MSNKTRIAINGFGRVGRAALKVILLDKKMEVVAINDLPSSETMANLFKYDSVYGVYDKKVSYDSGHLIINNKKIPYSSIAEPRKLPWKKHKVDVVLECTGVFRDRKSALEQVKAGAKKVIISAPVKGGGVDTYVFGVNEDKYNGDKVINNASCTTNCVAPVAQVIHSKFGIVKASMTTIHSYTADQRVVDAPHKDPRRARAAADNIIPTTTGAAIATTETIPELKGLFDGMAVRVPSICGSLADFTILTKKNVTVKQINNALITASKQPRFIGILEVTDEPIVSRDILGNPASSIIDLALTKVIDGNLVKIVSWYDNEWGYANRLVEMAEIIK